VYACMLGMYACMLVHVCVFMRAAVCAYACICMCMRTRKWSGMYIYVCVCIYIYNPCGHDPYTYMHLYINMHTRTYMQYTSFAHASALQCMHAGCTCIHKFTYTHAHIQASVQRSAWVGVHAYINLHAYMHICRHLYKDLHRTIVSEVWWKK
jgi:hypothetical protein